MSMPVSKKSNGEDVQNSRRSRSTASAPASEKRARRKSDSAVPATRRKLEQEVVAPDLAGAARLEREGARASAIGDIASAAGGSTLARAETLRSAAHPVNGNPAPPSLGAPANEIAASPTLDDAFVISPEERCRLIAEAAYFRAQRRGFDGSEQRALQDWLEAEAEIDRALSGANRD